MSDIVKLRIRPGGLSLKMKDNAMSEVFEELPSIDLEKKREELIQLQIEEAYQKGHNEALKKSKAEYNASLEEKMAVKTGEFNEILLSIDAQLKEYPKAFEEIVMKASFLLAEKILKREIQKESAVFENLKDAVGKVMGANEIFVRLNPADFQRINEEGTNFLMQDSFSKIKFEGDERIEKGGCYVETDIGNVDGRISAQMSELKKSLENLLSEPSE